MKAKLSGAQAAWFSCLGLALGESEFDRIKGYLAGIGAPQATEIITVAHWSEAAEVIRNPRWDSGWWDREEAERRRLISEAEKNIGRTVLLKDLTDATDRLSEAVHGAAAVAAARDGVADAGLIRAAAGAATMAAHQYELSRIAGAADDHPFACKFALFHGGRWPLGIFESRFVIF